MSFERSRANDLTCVALECMISFSSFAEHYSGRQKKYEKWPRGALSRSIKNADLEFMEIER